MFSGTAIPLAFTVPQEHSSKIKYLEPTSVGFLFFFKNTCTTYPRLCIIHLFRRLITKGVGMKAQVIYKIINLTNGKFYVGSTVNQRERFRCHRSRLRRNAHHSKHLQAAWNQYGEDNFLFKVIETIPDGESLQAAEDVWLAEHVGKEYCYNHSKFSDAPWRGVPKELQPNYGREVSTEQRQAISGTLKAYYAEAPENHPMYGATHTEEAKQRISSSSRPSS